MNLSKGILMEIVSICVVSGAIGLVSLSDNQAFASSKKAFPGNAFIKQFFYKTVCGSRNPGDRFVTSKDGTEVCDRKTGNIWEQSPTTKEASYTGQDFPISETPPEYCATLDLIGQAWRLPDSEDLLNLIDYRQPNPSIALNKPIGPFSNVLGGFYWGPIQVGGLPDYSRVVGFGPIQTNCCEGGMSVPVQ